MENLTKNNQEQLKRMFSDRFHDKAISNDEAKEIYNLASKILTDKEFLEDMENCLDFTTNMKDYVGPLEPIYERLGQCLNPNLD